MRAKTSFVAAIALAFSLGSLYFAPAQQPAKKAAEGQEQAGGFVPGQKRAPLDPQQVAHGKTLYGANCQVCHGRDLRGGDMGGPNLLRSQVTLSDQSGELIVPIIQGGRQAMGMPAIGLNIEDSNAVAAYVRSVIATIGRQGTPPGKQQDLNIVVGSAADGEAYFGAKCATCHSSQGDLKGIASRVPDPKSLQATWLVGGGRNGPSEAARSKITVIPVSGDKIEGTLVRMDDFLVTLKLADGSTRSVRRNGSAPKVIVSDPLKAHKDMLPIYRDKDIHDITAYLVTLK
jgi:cytochrome c oxidase cbb3-type subunit 3